MIKGEKLVGAALRGGDLGHREYEDCDLSGADLEGALLSGTTFRRCKLVGAVLRKARANGAKFYTCDLSRVDARGIDLSGAQLVDCTAADARFDLAEAPKLVTHRSDLSSSSWSGANLTRAELLDTSFASAVLDKARFPHATLARTNLEGTSMRDIVLRSAFFNAPRTTRVIGAPVDPWICTAKDGEALFDAWNAARELDPHFPALACSPPLPDEDLVYIQVGKERPDLDPLLATEGPLFELTTKWFQKVKLNAVVARRAEPPRMLYAIIDGATYTHPLEGALDIFSRFARDEGFTLTDEDVIGYAQLALFLTGQRTTREMAVISQEGVGWDVSLPGLHPTDPMVRVSVEPNGTVTRKESGHNTD